MPTFWLDSREAAERSSRYWWLFILAGISWMLFSLIVFRFNWVSVLAIGVLFGSIAVVSGLFEFAAASLSVGGWKVLRYALGTFFIAIGVIAFLTPGGTFVALAAVVSFFFVVAGAFDIVSALATRAQSPAWWFQLLAGVAQIALGFWAAGNWNRSVVLLVAWIGASTMFRGVAMIIFGFKLHALRQELEAVEATPREQERPQEPLPSYGN
ncbi:MAG: HdeD family acid-resistance protein [Gaiellaceae bacterium]